MTENTPLINISGIISEALSIWQGLPWLSHSRLPSFRLQQSSAYSLNIHNIHTVHNGYGIQESKEDGVSFIDDCIEGKGKRRGQP